MLRAVPSRAKTPPAPDIVPPLDAQKWPAANVVWKQVSALVPYARNARTHSEAQVAQIAASMREWGWTIPVLLDEKDGIIAGHGRILAAGKLGIDIVPCMVARGWSEAKKRAYILADNQLAQNAGWDEELLALELSDIEAAGFDLGLIGFDASELENLLGDGPGESGAGKLAEKFMLPPFSVLNAREGWWQTRKAAWLALGIQSELGRGQASAPAAAETEDLRDGLTHRTTLDPYRAKARKANAVPGGAPMPLDRAKNKRAAAKASPGGSQMPATNYGKSKARGDGRGREIKPGAGGGEK